MGAKGKNAPESVVSMSLRLCHCEPVTDVTGVAIH